MLPDPFQHLYDSLPWFLQWPVWFAVNIILIRGILANEIMSEIKQRSRLKGSIFHTMKRNLNSWGIIARKSAIVQHYHLQARGTGHESDSVLDCHQGQCAIL